MKNSLTGWHVASIMAPTINLTAYQGWTPCINWCEEQWGHDNDMFISQGDTWQFVGEGIFEFKYEKDLLLFLLRWGS